MFSPDETFQTWKDASLDELTKEGLAPFQCTTVTGDLLYIPEGWYHATQNEETTVGIAFQARNPAKEVNRGVVELTKFGALPMWQWYECCDGLAPPEDEREAPAMLANMEACCRSIIEAAPTWVPAYHNVGATYMMSGKHQQGVEMFEKALSLNHKYTPTMLTLTTAYGQMNRLEEAITTVQTYLRYSPGDANALQMEADINDIIQFDNTQARQKEALKLEEEEEDRKIEAEKLRKKRAKVLRRERAAARKAQTAGKGGSKETKGGKQKTGKAETARGKGNNSGKKKRGSEAEKGSWENPNKKEPPAVGKDAAPTKDDDGLVCDDGGCRATLSHFNLHQEKKERRGVAKDEADEVQLRELLEEAGKGREEL
jgi:tetratricopeptide (TPR) repeat protein